MTATGPEYDPFTLEIIQSSLQAVSDEMFAAMRKTAMSAIIYEVLDMGTAVTDRNGNLATSGAGIPSFVGVLDKAVRRIIELHDGVGAIREGDVFITNDPFFGGVTHLNDAVLAMPVFAGGNLMAWTANIAHWNDIGGMTPGSMSTRATQVFQEGLRLPAVKVIEAGNVVKPVVEIIKANSRLPDFLEGDLWAGIAAVRIGTARLTALIEKYGADAFEESLRRQMDYGEQVSLTALAALPKGEFEYSEEQDDGSVYTVRVTVADDTFTVDLTGNPDQVDGPYNTSRDGAVVAVQMLFKALTDKNRMANAGTFRPLRVITREGTVFHMREPAASGFYFEVRMRLYDLIWRCLAPHLGERLPAGHFASICGTVIGGTHPDSGKHFTIVEPQVGGWGGSNGTDGNSALFSGFHGETYNCPAEVAEARYGLYVDQLRLNDAPGGEGEFRGGKGIVLDYRVRSDDCFITVGYTRSRTPPWGLRGGNAGSPNGVEVIRAAGGSEHYAVATNVPLRTGDVVRVRTGNGGGYGEPKRRAPERVVADVIRGYTTRANALSIYGVAESMLPDPSSPLPTFKEY